MYNRAINEVSFNGIYNYTLNYIYNSTIKTNTTEASFFYNRKIRDLVDNKLNNYSYTSSEEPGVPTINGIEWIETIPKGYTAIPIKNLSSIFFKYPIKLKLLGPNMVSYYKGNYYPDYFCVPSPSILNPQTLTLDTKAFIAYSSYGSLTPNQIVELNLLNIEAEYSHTHKRFHLRYDPNMKLTKKLDNLLTSLSIKGYITDSTLLLCSIDSKQSTSAISLDPSRISARAYKYNPQNNTYSLNEFKISNNKQLNFIDKRLKNLPLASYTVLNSTSISINNILIPVSSLQRTTRFNSGITASIKACTPEQAKLLKVEEDSLLLVINTSTEFRRLSHWIKDKSYFLEVTKLNELNLYQYNKDNKKSNYLTESEFLEKYDFNIPIKHKFRVAVRNSSGKIILKKQYLSEELSPQEVLEYKQLKEWYLETTTHKLPPYWYDKTKESLERFIELENLKSDPNYVQSVSGITFPDLLTPFILNDRSLRSNIASNFKIKDSTIYPSKITIEQLKEKNLLSVIAKSIVSTSKIEEPFFKLVTSFLALLRSEDFGSELISALKEDASMHEIITLLD